MITIDLPPEVLEQITSAVEERVLERVSARADAGGGRWIRGAAAIATYIDAPKSRVDALSSARRIPVERDGSALVAHTDRLDRWIEEGGGKRP